MASSRILKNNFSALLLIACISMLTSCSSDYSKLKPLPTDIRPLSPAATGLPAYRIQIGDVLEIKFRLNPELDETVTVRPDGMISTAFAEDLAAYDKTVPELNYALRQVYKEELSDPKISTIVRSFAPTRIYVGGEVNQPGEFVVVGPPLTLTQAIARAGGIRNSSMPERVLVIRRGAGEKSEVFVADYEGATQGGDPTKDARLAPYDLVFVPKNGAAAIYKDYDQYFRQYITPSLGVSASYSLGNN
jgi:polysaccharide export outer membrane protein